MANIHPLREEIDAYVQKHYFTVPVIDIAAKFGVKRGYVQRRANRMGLKKGPQRSEWLELTTRQRETWWRLMTTRLA